MSESDEMKSGLQQAQGQLSTALAILSSLEAAVENVKTEVTIAAMGSNMAKAAFMMQALQRSMLELDIIRSRFMRIDNGLTEWVREL